MATEARFAYQIGAVGEAGLSDRQLYREAIADAELLHRLRYDAAWMVEHHFSDYYPQPNPLLFLSHIAAAYDWTLTAEARPFGRNVRFPDIIHGILSEGVAAGDVRPDVDLQELMSLLVGAYAWTYRLVITREADAKAMIAVMDRQIGLIAEGFAPRN